jgi:hypothetical protein
MPQYVKIIILISILGIVGIILLFFLLITIKKHKIRNMYLAIDQLLNQIVKENENFELAKSTEPEYDYKLKTNNNVYYLKVIPNFDSEEITINNSVKWQLRKSFNDNTMRFVPDVEGFMRYEIPSDLEINDTPKNKKKAKKEEEMTFSDLELDIEGKKEEKQYMKNIKMYIVYPNARSLLMYINECEMKFVNPNTDVYGTRVVTFQELEKNRDSLIK